MVNSAGYRVFGIISLVICCSAALFLLTGLVTPGWTVLHYDNSGDQGTGSSDISVTYRAGLWFLQICASTCMVESISSMGEGFTIKTIVQKNLVAYQVETTIALVLTLICVCLNIVVIKFPQHPVAMMFIFVILMAFNAISGISALIACGSKGNSLIQKSNVYDLGFPFSLMFIGIGALCNIAAMLVLIKPLRTCLADAKLHYRLPPHGTNGSVNSQMTLASQISLPQNASKSHKKTLKDYKSDYALQPYLNGRNGNDTRRSDARSGYSNDRIDPCEDIASSMDVDPCEDIARSMDVSVIHYQPDRRNIADNGGFVDDNEQDKDRTKRRTDRSKDRLKPKPRPRRTRPKQKAEEINNKTNLQNFTNLEDYPIDNRPYHSKQTKPNYSNEAKDQTINPPDYLHSMNYPTNDQMHYPPETQPQYSTDNNLHNPTDFQPSYGMNDQPNDAVDYNACYQPEAQSNYMTDKTSYFSNKLQPRYTIDDQPHNQSKYNAYYPPEAQPIFPSADTPYVPTKYQPSYAANDQPNYPSDNDAYNSKYSQGNFANNARTYSPSQNEANFSNCEETNHPNNSDTNYGVDHQSINPTVDAQVGRLENRNRGLETRTRNKRKQNFGETNYNYSHQQSDHSNQHSDSGVHNYQPEEIRQPRQTRTRRTRRQDDGSHITIPRSHETTI